MKYLSIILFYVLATSVAISQELTGQDLLHKAIAFHDPYQNWPTFNGDLKVTMNTPNKPARKSKILINLPEDFFSVQATVDTTTTTYTLNKGECTIALNGNKYLTEAELAANNLSCERALLYKNYYTYLYGLPMKLKDPGTIIAPDVTRKTFKGKEYLVLKVTYEEAVGNDIWFFYFDPNTFAMEVYQFFKTDDKGQLKPTTGEYILLTDLVEINAIKMPKVRAWYYNKNDHYLGTDTLKN
ncbi:MAG: hypothetical protein GYB32_10370 [Algicola sp.]|nr:hypothetical protein [Algicola sp.]